MARPIASGIIHEGASQTRFTGTVMYEAVGASRWIQDGWHPTYSGSQDHPGTVTEQRVGAWAGFERWSFRPYPHALTMIVPVTGAGACTADSPFSGEVVEGGKVTLDVFKDCWRNECA